MNSCNNAKEIQDVRTKFLPFGEVRRDFSFNAFNCMKAYSFDGQRFGYYGYDASGERTYKIDFDATFSKENGVIAVQSLDIEKMMLYPNGYMNINQSGEYTKHYYADALRIASKIGSGFTGNLCDSATATGYSSHLNIRMSLQSDIMVDELNEVVVPLQDIQQINPMPYPTFCNLDSGGQETNLFFYHPDHLGSTGLVTNNNASVIQGLFYAPFGEIISDYNPSFHDTLMPNYAFNAKELDEENGMYYYSARYYAPPTFISRDPMFEKYPSISPYGYCANNPMLFVDPNGRNPILPPVLAYYVTAKTMELGGNSSRVRQAGYAMQHPINAARVGQYNPGSNNISTTASNFQVNVAIAAGLSTGNEGDQGNAFRHALWQGIITNEMGANHAQRIGNTHEDNLNIDLNQRTFKNMGEADKAVDLLNNIIGREIGEENKGASNQTMAKKVAKEFYENGLWTTSQNKDGSVSIQRTRITKEQYNDAINEINKKGNNGLDK